MQKCVIISLIALTLSGCASSTNSIAAHVDRIGSMSDDVEVRDLRSARHNEVLNVQATLYNDSRSVQQVYYRCKFFDNNGFDLSSNLQWIPTQVYGKQTATVSCNANSSTAIDFKFELSSTGVALKVYTK